MKQIWPVLKKEVTDHWRDRRSVLNNLGLLALMGPMMFGPMYYTLKAQMNKSDTLKLAVIGAERAPALIDFLHSHEVQTETAPADYENRIRDGKLDTVLSIPEKFPASFSKGTSAKLELIVDDTQANSRNFINKVERLIENYSMHMGELRLLARGIDPGVMKAVKADKVDLAPPQQSDSFILKLTVGYGLFAAFVGAMAMSLDMSAGERERGSLEPLLVNPISPLKLLTGKWLAASLFSMAAVVITFTSYLVALNIFPFHTIGLAIRFGPAEFFLACLLVIPTSFLFAGVLSLSGLFAKTFKEAQITASLMIFIVMLPTLILVFKPMKSSIQAMAVPLLSQNLLLADLIRGNGISPFFALTAAWITFLIGFVCIVVASRIIQREKIIFGR
ncbi:MAG: ABC transporter permease [Burkholderiales bacterium]